MLMTWSIAETGFELMWLFMPFEHHLSWWNRVAHHVSSEGSTSWTGSHIMSHIPWEPNEVHRQSGLSTDIWPIGVCVNCSSDPPSQKNHIIKTTLALALTSILAGNLKAKEEPKSINYPWRKFFVGRTTVGSQWGGTHTCWTTVPWLWPGFLGFLLASLRDHRLRNLFWPVQPGLSCSKITELPSIWLYSASDLYKYESRNSQSMFIECLLFHS